MGDPPGDVCPVTIEDTEFWFLSAPMAQFGFPCAMVQHFCRKVPVLFPNSSPHKKAVIVLFSSFFFFKNHRKCCMLDDLQLSSEKQKGSKLSLFFFPKVKLLSYALKKPNTSSFNSPYLLPRDVIFTNQIPSPLYRKHKTCLYGRHYKLQ